MATRRGRAAWPAAAAVVALLACALLPLGARGGCVVRLQLQPNNSTFSMTGANTLVLPTGSRIPGAVTEDPTQVKGMNGALYMMSDITACPTTVEAWRAALTSFNLTSQTSSFEYTPIKIYPTTLLASTIGFRYQPRNIDLNMNTTLLQPNATSGDASAYTVTLNAGVTLGFLYSNTPVTGERWDALMGLGSTSSQQALINVQAVPNRPNVTSITLEIPDLFINLTTMNPNISFPSQPNTIYTSISTVIIRGKVLAQASLGCPAYCGDHGLCALGSDGRYGCVCECGWAADTNGSCTRPQGFCSQFGSGASGLDGSGNQTVVVRYYPAPPSPPAPPPAVCNCSASGGGRDGSSPASIPLSSTGVCPTGYGLDVLGTTCFLCDEGWAGGGCSMCQNDQACRARGDSSSAAQCLQTAIYQQKSTVKNYTCAITDESTRSLLGNTVRFSCSTLPPANASLVTDVSVSNRGGGFISAAVNPVGTTPFCSLEFRATTFTAGAFVRCTGWGCSFGRNSSRVSCSTVKCQCPLGCTTTGGENLRPTFEGVDGAITLSCANPTASSPTEQDCRIDLTGLPIASVSATCSTSECYDPTSQQDLTFLVDDSDVQPTKVGDAVIAAIPFMVLALIGLLGAAGVAVAHAYLRGARRAAGQRDDDDQDEEIDDAPEEAGGARPVGEGAETLPIMLPAGQADGAVAAGADSGPASAYQHESSGVGSVSGSSGAGPRLPPPPEGGAAATPPRTNGAHAHGQPGSSSPSATLPDALKAGSVLKAHAGPLGLCGPVFRFVDISVSAVRRQWVTALFAKPPTPEEAAAAAAVAQQGGCNRRGGGGLAHLKVILQDVSGCAAVGEVVGIMGPSGSGKSTLLNVLSGQICSGGAWHLSGQVRLGKQPLRARDLVTRCAAVPQHDLLLRFLTVEEALRCSAALRLGPGVRGADVDARVSQTLHELNMWHLRSRMLYKGSLALLSGGERQRVSIAMELVTNPQLLLLDEPTSGLDSFNALQVLHTLQAVAAGGRIVVTSLHQPSPVIFNMLSKVLLITQGRLAFVGAPGDAPEAFAALGLPCSNQAFIAEHMLEVVGNRRRVAPLLDKISQPSFVEHVRQLALQGDDDPASDVPAVQRALSAGLGSGGSCLGKLLPGCLSGGSHSSNGGAARDEEHGPVLEPSSLSASVAGGGGSHAAPQSAPWVRQVGIILWRGLVDSARSPALVLMHMVFSILLGIVVGFTVFQTGNDTAGAQNRVGVIFFAMNLFAFMSVTAVDLLQLERQVVEREMVRRHYDAWTYMGAKVLVDSVLLRGLPAAAFSTLLYWLMGLRPSADAFITYLFVFMTYTALVGALALACSALVPTMGRALLLLNLILIVCVLFAGFLVRTSSIPWALRWLCYVSPMRYTWQALVINELQPLTLQLTAEGLPPVPPVQGRLFLSILGVDPDSLTEHIIVLNCFYAAVAFLAMAAMATRVVLLRNGWAS